MKFKLLIYIFLSNFIFSQINHYLEPLSFNSGNNNIKDLNNFKNIIINQDAKIIQYYINNINNDFNYLSLYFEHLPSDILFFIINQKTSTYVGPYDYLHLKNNIINTDPIKGNKLILEINNINNPIYSEFECTIEIKDFTNNSRIEQQKQLPIKSREEPIIMLTGYWPPTNEMIRHFSQSNQLNPEGWQGDNWENSGYDIISYFPTFSTPDCSNCGQGNGAFEVDYQNTSNDFWPISESHSPIALITFSRGYINYSWEMEFNAYNRTNWINDYSTPFLPTPNPPDENEETYYLRNSNLPMNNIVENINNLNLGLDPYIDTEGDPGHFVSEFMAYHGTWYRDLNLNGEDKCYVAGHIHVGGQIDWNTAQLATEETIRTLIDYLDEFTYVPGDVNQDDIIDILDLVIIMNYILRNNDLSIIEFYASDLNEDTNINIQDIIILINIILNNF